MKRRPLDTDKLQLKNIIEQTLVDTREQVGNIDGIRGPEFTFNGSRYTIYRLGALSFILDENGNRVSDGYHKIEAYTFNDESITGIIAHIGSKKAILQFPDSKSGYFMKSEKFHEIEYRSDLEGLFVFQIGAMHYVLNPETGKADSSGYHSIFMKNGQLYGNMGDKTEKIILHSTKLHYRIK